MSCHLFCWQTSKELSKICNELNEKNSEIKRLQMELNRREDDDAGGVLDGLKRVIVGLEKEISSLKVGNLRIICLCFT